MPYGSPAWATSTYCGLSNVEAGRGLQRVNIRTRSSGTVRPSEEACACAISTILLLNRWRTAILAIIATIPFAYAMIVATLLHLDRFATGSVRFWVWLVIYAVLPIGLPVIWVRNRGADPGPEPGE